MADDRVLPLLKRLWTSQGEAHDQVTKDRLEAAAEKIKQFHGASAQAIQLCTDYVSELCKDQPREDVVNSLTNALDVATKPADTRTFLDALDNLDSASQFAARSKTVLKSRGLIEEQKGRLLNYRPHSEHGVPLQIMSTAFSTFAREAKQGHPSPNDCAIAYKLVEIASQLVDDERVGLQKPILAALETYLGPRVSIISSRANADPSADLAFDIEQFKVCFGELKKDTGGNSRAQNERYYVANVVETGQESAAGLRLLEQFCLPSFSLEINSATLRVGALAIIDRAILSEPLTDAINLVCSNHPLAMLRVARTLAALRNGMWNLAEEYKAAVSRLDLASKPRAFWPAAIAANYSDRDVEQLFPHRPLYVVKANEASSSTASSAEVKQDRLLKYWQRVDEGQRAEDVHAAWANAGVAPKLFQTVEEGEWLRSEMEYLSHLDGWAPLRYYAPATWGAEMSGRKRPKVLEDSHCPKVATAAEWERLGEAAEKALDVGHSTLVGGSKKGVHGDVRLDNVMARRGTDGKWEVKIVDFGWSGTEGEASYPVVMSSAHPWAPTAKPGLHLLQRHDSHMLRFQVEEGSVTI